MAADGPTSVLQVGTMPTYSGSVPPPSYGQDDDIVFEDFARLRLKGLKDDKEDDDHFC